MLIIVESPAKAKTIGKIVGSKYVVKASVGHIRGLSDEKKTKDGRSLEINGIDIDHNFEPIYVIDKDKAKVVSELKKLAKDSKDGILFATDSDREGEAISWHLAEVLGIKDKSTIKRLEFHEITKKAIEEALNHPRPLNLELVSAQQARQVLDKLVGFKLSPVLWATMGNYKLSAGRVQSPALKIISDREKEILAFKPEELWSVNGLFSQTQATPSLHWKLAEDDKEEQEKAENEVLLELIKIKGTKIPEKISSKEQLLQLVDNLEGISAYTVISTQNKRYTTSPKPPFTTSTLQQAASSRLGLPPKQTMQIAQKLYEGIDVDGSPTALITYMRTDSVQLSQDSIQAARSFISSKFPAFLPSEPRYYRSKSKNSQEAHEAIRPTDISRTPDSLKNKLEPRMWKVYDLIWRQTVASQMKDEQKESVTFNLQNTRKDEFVGSISWTISPGYKAVTGEKTLAKPVDNLWIKNGETAYIRDIYYTQKFTKPPSRYSPASLIKKLEELGIGRPSTYASIISTLQDREYVETKQNIMFPTTLGMKIADILGDNFHEVTSQELTAQMEENLDAISRGEKEYKDVLNQFWSGFKKEVEEKSSGLKANRSQYTSSQSDVACPNCGSPMELRLGRFGEYLQCTVHKEHIFAKNFREYEVALKEAQITYAEQVVGKKCEECSKDIIVRVSKSSLKPYLACPEYKVGNKHTVMPVNFGPCPECVKNKRKGVLVQKSYKGRSFIACSLPKEQCGYIQK